MKQTIKKSKIIMWIGFVIFIGVFFAIYFNFQEDLNDANSKLKGIPSKVFISKYGNIEYLLAGDGPTILISHGVTGGVDQGLGLSDLYVGKGYQFVYVSRFGYLKSSMPNGATARLQAAAYKELLDYLDIEKVFIVGNSAGGPSAMYFAVDYPEKCKGLILISSTVPSAVPGAKISSPPDIIFKSDFVYWVTTKIARKSLMKMFIPSSIQDTMTKQEIKKVVSTLFVAALPISKRSSGTIFDTKISNPSVDTVPFEQIKSQTLIIHAIDDPAPPYEEAKKISNRIPYVKLVSIEDGGHILLRHEEEVKKEIYSFIERLERKEFQLSSSCVWHGTTVCRPLLLIPLSCLREISEIIFY